MPGKKHSSKTAPPSGASKKDKTNLVDGGADLPTADLPAENLPAENLPTAKLPTAKLPATFPVVALGASAGGLEAFTLVLRNLPPDTGMAFVLIQHLDPKHESLLVDLLSRSTAMSVEQVRDGLRIAPNCVYVIPPNSHIAIQDSVFRLTARTATRGLFMPIDHFLRSLAEDAKSRAVGVILSGTSSDGSLGIEAIKGEGGITFAQDQKTAKYDGMPRSALATGCVDFVLPPEGIARELIRISQHPYVRSAPEELAGVEPPVPRKSPPSHPMSRIFALLRAATSVDFSLYRHTTIHRRMERRMALHKIEKLEDYVRLVEQNPAELEALYGELLIKVTSFFRDPEAFQSLKTIVFPEMPVRPSAESPIRVWVPGCATGEEAYSIGMALLEYLGESRRNLPIQIFATDVSDEAIEKARSGIYLENISLDVSPERLHRFFVKHDGGYQVNKSLRDVCVFARQNVAKDPPFSRLDLISCRNVLIYLEPVLQKRIIAMFQYALKPQGYLLLGASETIGPGTDLFELKDPRHKIYAKRPNLGTRRFDLDPAVASPGGPDVGGPALLAAPEAAGPDLQKEADRVVLATYAPPGVIINEAFDVVHYRGRTSPYLEAAPGRASLNLLKMVREGLLVEVRNAIQEAKRSGEPVKKNNIRVERDHGFQEVDFEVIPLQPSAAGRHYLIVFRDSIVARQPTTRDKRTKRPDDGHSDQLKQELVATRQYLQAIIEEQEATNEELQSANEEILSSNEELQSINEELETAKEELQSTNEELTTVNEELQNRNAGLSLTNDDLNNLLSSLNIAIVMLGSDLCVQRFTPMASRILNLIPSDVGRPITDLRPSIKTGDLGQIVREVLTSSSQKESDVVDGDGRRYSLSVRPYRTAEGRVIGAVIVLVDTHSLLGGSDPSRWS